MEAQTDFRYLCFFFSKSTYFGKSKIWCPTGTQQQIVEIVLIEIFTFLSTKNIIQLIEY